MADSRNVLAGLAGYNGTPDLIHIADASPSLVLPTDAISAPPVGFASMGYLTTNGLTNIINTNSQEIDAFGVTAPVRILITSEVEEFTLAGEEANKVSIAVYNRLKLSAVTAGPNGSVVTSRGAATDAEYCLIMTLADGLNRIRRVVPRATLVTRANQVIQKGQNVEWGFTFRAALDDNGVSVYEYYNLVSLGAS